LNSLGYYHYVPSLQIPLIENVEWRVVYRNNVIYNTTVYLGAVTKGYVFNTIPLTIDIGCYGVELSLASKVFVAISN
jgi:hypothetical protein